MLGLGQSISLYEENSYDLSIGVNDIWKIVKTDVVVCLNKPNEFIPDRLKWINDSRPEAFYSQAVIWDIRPDFRKIDFIPGYPDRFCKLDSPAYHKSFCSPFVACQVAYKEYHADEIHLFGVDLVDHPHLDKNICAKIKIHFENLNVALKAKGCILMVHGNGILTTLL